MMVSNIDSAVVTGSRHRFPDARKPFDGKIDRLNGPYRRYVGALRSVSKTRPQYSKQESEFGRNKKAG